jgi:uncharacterized protein (DUF2336 family)
MLTEAHLRALRANPSGAVRTDIAAAIAADVAAAALSEREAAIARQILEILSQDVERGVRQALAEQLKQSPFLPREIALALARDIADEVALPILQYSPVLGDADLVLHVRAGPPPRRLAVARRGAVSPAVGEALVETGDPAIVEAVLGNAGADLAEPTLLKVALRFRGDAAIEECLVERPALPLTVCEVLIASVSAALRARLVARHRIPEFLAEELARHAREAVLLDAIAGDGAAAGERLAAHLQARRRLTPTLVLRALCGGDLGFFEAAMAQLAGLPAAQARALIYDRGVGGLRAIYQRAALPPELFRAFRVAVGAVLEGHLRRGAAAYTEHVVGQLVLAYDDLCPAGIEHVLAQLARRPPGERDAGGR